MKKIILSFAVAAIAYVLFLEMLEASHEILLQKEVSFAAAPVEDPNTTVVIQWRSEPGTTFIPYQAQDSVSVDSNGWIGPKTEETKQYVIISRLPKQ